MPGKSRPSRAGRLPTMLWPRCSPTPGFEATEGAETGPDLAGQLGAVSMAEVLTLLGQQGQTGTLRVLNDGARVDLFFRKGRIDLAVAVGVAEEFLLGRFAVESGHLTPDALAQVLDERARMSGKPPLFGRDLVSRGLITPAGLKGAMRRQTAELAYETLRWARGSFQFRRADDLPELVEEASLGITVDTLLLEGISARRRVEIDRARHPKFRSGVRARRGSNRRPAAGNVDP